MACRTYLKAVPHYQSHTLKICSYLSGLDSDRCFGKTYDELVRNQQIKSLVAQTGSVNGLGRWPLVFKSTTGSVA